jgi:hypothetical protein
MPDSRKPRRTLRMPDSRMPRKTLRMPESTKPRRTLRMPERIMPRRTFGLLEEETAERYRKLHFWEVHNFYSWPRNERMRHTGDKKYTYINA